MKRLLWLAIGVGLGFVAAHFAARTSRGAAIFGALDARMTAFLAAVADGFRERSAELRGE